RPPDVPTRLEDREGTLPGRHRLTEPARERVDVREAALGERADVVEAPSIRDPRRLVAVGDRHLRLTAGEAVEVPRPVVPRSLAPGIGDRLDQGPDPFQRLDVLRVLAQGELDLGLLDHGIDPAK